MHRSFSILFIQIAVTVCSVLVPAPAGAQKEGPGITIKKDGDFVVLTPREPGKAFLVLGIPRERKGQESVKGLQGDLIYQAGAVRLPAKEWEKYERVLFWELGPGAEVGRDQIPKPLPPDCPPHCPQLLVLPEFWAYLIWPAAAELEGKAVQLPGAEIP